MYSLYPWVLSIIRFFMHIDDVNTFGSVNTFDDVYTFDTINSIETIASIESHRKKTQINGYVWYP